MEANVPIDVPDDWEPKSDYWKWVMSKVRHELKHKKWHLQCPCCRAYIGLDVVVQDPDK